MGGATYAAKTSYKGCRCDLLRVRVRVRVRVRARARARVRVKVMVRVRVRLGCVRSCACQLGGLGGCAARPCGLGCGGRCAEGIALKTTRPDLLGSGIGSLLGLSG